MKRKTPVLFLKFKKTTTLACVIAQIVCGLNNMNGAKRRVGVSGGSSVSSDVSERTDGWMFSDHTEITTK